MHPSRIVLIGFLVGCGVSLRAQTIGDFVRRDNLGEATSDWTERPEFPVIEATPYTFNDVEHAYRSEASNLLRETSPLRKATMLQLTPLSRPRSTLSPEIDDELVSGGTAATVSFSSRLFGSPGVERSLLRQASLAVPSLSVDLVDGADAGPLMTTDLGNLLKKSGSALSVETQTRTPIINDSRVRSSRIGSLAASGSHWVPARADIDTALSKIDSRLVGDVIIIPGPYSSVYGPAFNVIDFKLEPSPRFAGGRETHGVSSFEHKANGNQWFGQQTLLTGGENWGVRGSYSYRLGSDYESGDGQSVAADYDSRMVLLSMGRDLDRDRTIEGSLLRLDQSDVEFPGFVFDINNLATDGYEVTYHNDDSLLGDRAETEVWYNRTDFDGDFDNAAKSRNFPFLNFVDFNGSTDADVMSTGYRRAVSWETDHDCHRFTLGHDLRLIKQEVNEVFNTLLPNDPVRIFGQSPLPRSISANPGLFAEYFETFCCDYTFHAGARGDFVQTDIIDEGGLQSVGVSGRPYDEVIGTDEQETHRWLWGLYGRLERRYTQRLSGSVSLGYAQRPPTLTELYGVEQLLLVVQNGLNTMTGDPRLKSEQLIQFDLTLDYVDDSFRAGVRGFGGWAFDYITYENARVIDFAGETVQTNLRAVNTGLATLAGFESYAELSPGSRCNPFVTARYVDGRDRTRNGDFATVAADQFTPSTRIDGLPRGFFSFVPGNSDSEPLPGISPFEMRAGMRLRDSSSSPSLTMELSARIVDNQDRVATSLLEFPTPGFTVWDVRLIWEPERWERLAVYAGVENFTDKTYREHLDFRSLSGIDVYQPGANFYFGTDLAY